MLASNLLHKKAKESASGALPKFLICFMKINKQEGVLKMAAEMSRPLAGIKVVDFSTYAAVPVVGRIMADWGAEVIKVESTSGDAWRFFGPTLGVPYSDEENPAYDLVNGYKKHVAVNLKDPAGIKIMHELLAEADVFISNVRMQALKKLGLTYEDLKEKYPRMVWAHLSGFGPKGPDCDRPGFDIVSYWARSGAMIDLCQPDAGPITPPYGFGDVPSGTALLAGICAALFKQKCTGEGEKVEVSLYGNAIWSAGMMVLTAQDTYGDPWPKARTTPPSPLSSSYRCADGEWLILGILEPARYWSVLCNKVIDRPDLAEDVRYNSVPAAKKNADTLVALLDEAFAKKPRSEWEKLLIENDIAYDNVVHFKDVTKDPQAWENNFLTEVEFRNGNKAAMPNTPIQFGGAAPAPIHNVGRLGEDTRAVLQQLGYTDEQIDELATKNVVKVRE